MGDKGLNILLIEDNPADARLIQEQLKDAKEGPFELTWTQDLASGLERLGTSQFDIILLDLGLPDSVGYNTFVKVHGQAPWIPIVVLTGLDDEEMAQRVVRGGAQDYLFKGRIESRLLGRSIRYAMERQTVKTFRDIFERTAAVIGDDFFRSLVSHLASALRVRYALVARFVDTPPTRAQTLAFWTGQEHGENFEYLLTGTPCERVVSRGERCHYPEGLKELFCEDGKLVNLGMESFLGTPLINSQGHVIGHLCVFDDKVMYAESWRNSIIKIFAARAGAELERLLAEEALRRSEEKLRQMVQGIIGAIMSMVEVGDPYTSGHQKRVALLATAIGQRIGLPEEQVQGLHYAALIHDLGKIYVPAQILNKPGRLNDIEFNLIKMHSKVGYDILKTVDFPWPVADIVVQHHERVDGSGYPNGLIGTDILLESRILAVADVVEAMTSHRPYRRALGLDRALQEIQQGRGNLYDPKAVDACLELIREGYRFDIVADPIRKGNRRKGLQLNRWTL